MPYPNFAGKHAEDAYITPQHILAYRRRRGVLPDVLAPRGVILTYRPLAHNPLLALEAMELQEGFTGNCYLLSETDGRIGLCGGFGIGAPAATMILEDYVALGTRQFVSIGAAGALQPGARIGDLVVCDRAIRDEGVSHHYLAPAPYAYPSATLTASLAQQLERAGSSFAVGASWTIDAPYRETVAEARHYQREGVLTVEMEAAALCAVAQHRGVELATAFVVSDSLAADEWSPAFEASAVNDGLVALFWAARAALLG